MSDQKNVSPATSAQVSVVLTCAAPRCTYPVPATRRKYCDLHGPQASMLRKREVRRDERAAYKAAGALDPAARSTYLRGWPSREKYNERCRDAMRESRKRARGACERQRKSNSSPRQRCLTGTHPRRRVVPVPTRNLTPPEPASEAPRRPRFRSTCGSLLQQKGLLRAFRIRSSAEAAPAQPLCSCAARGAQRTIGLRGV